MSELDEQEMRAVIADQNRMGYSWRAHEVTVIAEQLLDRLVAIDKLAQRLREFSDGIETRPIPNTEVWATADQIVALAALGPTNRPTLETR